MKCEICGRTAPLPPDGDGITLHRVNPLGVAGIWRCVDHLTPAQIEELDPETVELVKIIEGDQANELKGARRFKQ